MTVTVPLDSNKPKVQSHDDAPRPKKPRGGRGNSQNEGVLPTQSAPVGGRLSHFGEGWKRIMNNPYVLSIVIKGYGTDIVLRVHPMYLILMGNTISPGAPGSTGNARANIPDASEE